MLQGNKRRALLLAREYIDSGEEKFICYALSRVMSKYPALYIRASELILEIQKALAPHFSLELWQFKKLGHHSSNDEARHDRLAWIDWILENWE